MTIGGWVFMGLFLTAAVYLAFLLIEDLRRPTRTWKEILRDLATSK